MKLRNIPCSVLLNAVNWILVKHGTECCNAMTALHGYQKLYLDARAHVDLNWILHYCDKAFYHVMQSLRQMERELSAERIHASVASTKKGWANRWAEVKMTDGNLAVTNALLGKCTSGRKHYWIVVRQVKKVRTNWGNYHDTYRWLPASEPYQVAAMIIMAYGLLSAY